MSEFHERLRERKQQIINERNPQPETVNESDVRRMELEFKLQKIKDTAIKLLIGASIFMGLFSYFVFKDWYMFVGSREYAEWREGKDN